MTTTQRSVSSLDKMNEGGLVFTRGTMKRLRDKRRVADMYIQASLSVFFVKEIITPHETVTIYPKIDSRPEVAPQSSVLASTSQP